MEKIMALLGRLEKNVRIEKRGEERGGEERRGEERIREMKRADL